MDHVKSEWQFSVVFLVGENPYGRREVQFSTTVGGSCHVVSCSLIRNPLLATTSYWSSHRELQTGSG